MVNTLIKKIALFLPRTKGQALVVEKKKYQGIISSIIFSMVETRLDIAFATSVASQFIKNPSHQYTKVVKTIFQYLKGSKKQKITYGSQEELLVQGYIDFD